MREFNHHEKQLIAQWRQSLAHEVKLSLVLNPDARSEQLRQFGQQLRHEAPEVVIHTDRDEGVSLPALVPHEFIKLHGIPLEKELVPFLELLSLKDATAVDLSENIRARADQVTLPAALKLYTMPRCPFCPQMVQKLARLACICELVDLAIVDGHLFQDEAQKDGIHSAPTLILEDHLRWNGLTGLSEILDAVVDRDSFHLGISSLKRMLTQGRAQELAEMMLTEKALFPAFIDLLTDKKWPVRLGAMVALEYLAESDLSLSQKIIAPISDRFHHLSDTVKGDVLYLFGLAGDEGTLPFLNEILSKERNASVKEAAREAIDALHSHHK